MFKTRRMVCIFLLILLPSLLFATTSNETSHDPLLSWNDQPLKQNIMNFVKKVTDANDNAYVRPEERIAVFDNDGTLWVEQPLYTQAIFALDRVKQLAPSHPEWKAQEPFKTILSGNKAAIAKLPIHELVMLIIATHTGMTVENFDEIVKQWLEKATNPHFHRTYLQLVYQPMLELIRYLQANQFTVYIVTGGGQEFVRAFSEGIYNVSPEHVIGTTAATKYSYQNGKPVLIKTGKVILVDNFAGKPEGIELFIGRKPIMAFGNSDGDKQMLEYTESNPHPHFMALVHHDDAQREFAYGPNSKVGTFSNALMKEAQQHQWNVISMKKDWQTIFPNN